MTKKDEERPYVFRPPKYNRWLVPLFQQINRWYLLKRKFRTVRLEMRGEGPLVEAYRKQTPVLVAPNHPDDCDPMTMFEVARRTRMPFRFMAAREQFDPGGGLQGWLIQRAGAFSIDREGGDRKSIMTALEFMTTGHVPLVIFPEGNIHHTNERLAPLNEGVATILLRAAAKRAKEGNGDALLVPTAIKYSYVEDISHTFSPCLDRLERQISWEPQRHLDIMDRIYKFGEAMLAVKEREWLGEPLSGDLVQRLQQFRIKLLEPLEVKYEFSHEGTVPQRIKRLKNKIRQILFDDEPTPEQIVEYRKDLKRLFTAKQLYTYPGQYLRERATQDRIAETIIKLEKDVLGKTVVRGRRKVTITFGDTVSMAGYLDAGAKDAKQTVSEVTEHLERAIAGLLEPPAAKAATEPF